MIEPQDQAQRQTSLDINHSFIVQAPAGSGKTSLLTQRFLRLLTRVRSPEEILAITFTRKAAAEMHQRIIESLKLAQKPKPSDEFEAQTWLIAAQVLQHDADCEWHLLQNPNRLRVQTIDSLCANLTKQLPVTSHFGSPPAIQQDARPMYTEAARNCLQELDDEDEVGEAIRLLLSHLDNQLPRAESLVSAMLASRDQWLRHIISGHSAVFNRSTLEGVLQRSIEQVLFNTIDALDEGHRQTLQDLLAFASSNMADVNSPISQYGMQADLTQADASTLDTWQMVARFLQNDKGEWRKQASANLGFPAANSSENKQEKALFGDKKKQYKALLAELADNTVLKETLSWVTCLPASEYTEQQWQFIQALFVVLPNAVGHLRLVFQQQGQVDFCEVSLSASYALHDTEGMTEVGLRLDYQLQHILVDEFQDTSETQFMLLKDLVAGWQPGDGRTLFLVGDPMQSIYRFRQAEVGLFLKTQQQGLGEVSDIQALNISVNFRSQAGVVDWVNKAFAKVMPKEDNLYSGAISYKPSRAFKQNGGSDAVRYYPHPDRPTEGQALLELIQQIQQTSPNDSIGVLVRGRSHLLDLVAAMNKAGLAYQASDIAPLSKRQTVIDLMSLTRAYLHPADRVAWLSVLRAPWCGLSLNDMHALLAGEPNTNVWDLLKQNSRLEGLSDETQQSLQHVIKVITTAFEQRDRMSLAESIEGVWNEFFGPECLTNESDLSDVQRFFDCLSELESAGRAVDMTVLENTVEKLYAAADVNAADNLQIMTIHKAKGLEFDHVILPGLDRKSRNDDKRLLAWLERPSEASGDSELLIAPIKETGSEGDDAIGKYLNKIEQEKSHHESQRLLYVAATRAKKRLHLSFCVLFDEKKGELKTPASNTLLGLLWPMIKADISVEFDSDNLGNKESVTHSNLSKLNINKVSKVDNKYLDFKQGSTCTFKKQTQLVEFDWATDLAASIGTVCHKLMQVVGERGLGDVCVVNDETTIRHQLFEVGVLPQKMNEAIGRVKQIMNNCLQDNRGQWVLNNAHQHSAFELGLSGVVKGDIMHCRLDRTFVDDGKRWIIDYKTSRHEDDNKEQFLDEEESRYKPQLEKYAQLMSAMDSRPIMLGLYYPAFGGWRSWEFHCD
jgi:ATP-dependent exoDNAse (exonuclease V) beta subunit